MQTLEYEYDVVVVGGGTAGPMAAIKAKQRDPRLRVLLLDKAAVRCSGAISMGLKELRLPEAARPAMAALAHPDATVRREAVGVPGWLKSTEVLSLLSDLVVRDPDGEVRRTISGALGLAAPISLAGATAVGQYALQLAFSDGHERGIYPWELLGDLAGARFPFDAGAQQMVRSPRI